MGDTVRLFRKICADLGGWTGLLTVVLWRIITTSWPLLRVHGPGHRSEPKPAVASVLAKVQFQVQFHLSAACS